MRVGPVRALLLPVLLAAAAPAAAFAQSATVAGRVLDSASAPVPGAEVAVTRSPGDDGPVGAARTGDDGRFAIAGLTAGARYRLVVRRVGFRPDTVHAVATAADRPTEVVVRLRALAAALDPVTVRGRRANPLYRPFIDSTEIAASRLPRSFLRTAWDVVERLRPVMKGEWWKLCPATADVFVNGRRATAPNIVSPGEVLREIPAGDILEMRYVNCWDTTMPGVAGRNAVYVVLKPGRAYRY